MSEFLPFIRQGQGEGDEKEYKAYASAKKNRITSFALWGKNNARMYYPYHHLGFMGLNTDASLLVLHIQNDYILIEGKGLDVIARELQYLHVEYLRELPIGEQPPADKPYISSINRMEEFNPAILAGSPKPQQKAS